MHRCLSVRHLQPIHKSFPQRLFSLTLSMELDFSDERRPYRSAGDGFQDKDLASKDPFIQFAKWHDEAVKVEAAYELNAACLATCSSSGQPSARMVLLKGCGHDGFKFFTNYCSRKGEDLLTNPKAALLVYWDAMSRQIRIEGPVEKLPMDVATEYFSRRPRSSQLSAAISQQSAVVKREDLVNDYAKMDKEYGEEKSIPKPETWGGFVLKPETFEFWQGQSNRLHDRIRFRKLAPNEKADGELVRDGLNGWVYETLAP